MHRAKGGRLKITLVDEDILSSNLDIICNPVNLQGVTGAGLAKQFLQAYPQDTKVYKEHCRLGRLRRGGVLFTNEARPILHVPTKRRWQESSCSRFLEASMRGLSRWMNAHRERYHSIAIPALAAGLGRQPWGNTYRLVVDLGWALEDSGQWECNLHIPQGGTQREWGLRSLSEQAERIERERIERERWERVESIVNETAPYMEPRTGAGREEEQTAVLCMFRDDTRVHIRGPLCVVTELTRRLRYEAEDACEYLPLSALTDLFDRMFRSEGTWPFFRASEVNPIRGDIDFQYQIVYDRAAEAAANRQRHEDRWLWTSARSTQYHVQSW